MTDRSSKQEVGTPDDTKKRYNVPRVCLTCHAERLGYPVTPSDCLGFAACETCTKLPPIDGGESDSSQPVRSP